VFAVLTRLPVQPRIHPVEAMRIVTDNILPRFEVVSLGKKDYLEALNMMASGGLIGAKPVLVATAPEMADEDRGVEDDEVTHRALQT
jgi:hypothetical protein